MSRLKGLSLEHKSSLEFFYLVSVLAEACEGARIIDSLRKREVRCKRSLLGNCS